MTKKHWEMEELRSRLNKLLEESEGVITEEIIEASQALDKLIAEKVKEEKNKDQNKQKSSQ